MKTLNVSSALFAAAMFVAVSLTGCTEAAERIDCRDVCSRYQECFDSDYDVDQCVAECSDSDDVNQADECESCIDGASCTESFACTTECAGIVP